MTAALEVRLDESCRELAQDLAGVPEALRAARLVLLATAGLAVLRGPAPAPAASAPPPEDPGAETRRKLKGRFRVSMGEEEA